MAASIVGGSVARGCADEFSDLEIGVFWEEPPSDAERRRAIERLDCEVWKFESGAGDTEGAAVEHLGLRSIEIGGSRHIGMVMVSVQHLTLEAVEARLADVIDRWDTAVGKQNLVYAIQHGLVLLFPLQALTARRSGPILWPWRKMPRE